MPAGVMNRDPSEWESDLSTFARDDYPGTSFSGLETAIVIFPLPVWKGLGRIRERRGCALACLSEAARPKCKCRGWWRQ